MLSEQTKKLKMAEIIGSKLNISKKKVGAACMLEEGWVGCLTLFLAKGGLFAVGSSLYINGPFLPVRDRNFQCNSLVSYILKMCALLTPRYYRCLVLWCFSDYFVFLVGMILVKS